MPKLFLEVPDTEASTARPITLEIIRQVVKNTGLNRNTNIVYPSELETDAQPGSRLNSNEINKFPSMEKVYVDVEEDYVADRLLATAIHRPENNFIFIDHALDAYIKPTYSSTEVTVNFKYRSQDRVKARKWRDDIRNYVSMMRDVCLHTVDYHYLIPDGCLYILKEIHRLRENVEGYGEDFDTYLKNHSTQRLTQLTNLAGKQDAWGIAETQMRIQGWFDFEGVPEQGDKANDSDAWEISFSYKFRYDKALACSMHYPLMIHNQPLGKKFRHTKPPYELEQQQRSYSLSVWHLSHFEKNSRNPASSAITGLAIPDIDDFIPSQVLPSSMRVLTALVKIKPEDKRTLLDFKALGKYKLQDVFLDFLMNSEAPYVTQPYESIINVSAYRNINMIPHRFVQVDNTGVVSITDDLELREYHHVRLSLITDLSSLSKAALDRLRENGCAFRLIMMVINSALAQKGLLPISMCTSGYVTREQLGLVMQEMDKYKLDEIYQFNTVMNLYINSNQMDKP